MRNKGFETENLDKSPGSLSEKKPGADYPGIIEYEMGSNRYVAAYVAEAVRRNSPAIVYK
jgi:hypothetical protein